MKPLQPILICCNECGKNLISELMSATPPRAHISSTCNVRTKLGEFINHLICLVLLICYSCEISTLETTEIRVNHPVYLYAYTVPIKLIDSVEIFGYFCV